MTRQPYVGRRPLHRPEDGDQPIPGVEPEPECVVVGTLSPKGGCAKTTVTATLNMDRVHNHGDTTLTVDLDAQANMTSHLTYSEEANGNISRALLESMDGWTPEHYSENVTTTKVPSIAMRYDLVAGDTSFEETLLLLEYRRRRDPSIVFRLKEALDELRPYYHYIFIDTPPSLRGLTVDLTLHAADVIIMPIDGTDAIIGMLNLLPIIQTASHERVLRGDAPLQLYFTVGKYLPIPKATPVGPYGVKAEEWFQVMYEAFPKHFIPAAVRTTLSPERTSQPGDTWRAMTAVAKHDYRRLCAEVFSRISDQSIPAFPDWLQSTAFNPEDLRLKVREVRAKNRNNSVVSRARFFR
jgi:cellulose biosynthesis protein BcsQ